MTLPWPWDNYPMKPTTNPCHHVYLAWVSTCLYMTHSYKTLRVKGTILWWPLVTLSMHRKYADPLKLTWYIVRFKKKWSTKIPRGGGGGGLWLLTHGLNVFASEIQMRLLSLRLHNKLPVFTKHVCETKCLLHFSVRHVELAMNRHFTGSLGEWKSGF